MRLLSTSTLTFTDFSPNLIPKYAILSHTWGEDEILYDDIVQGKTQKKSIDKVLGACAIARADRHEFIWIDNCCIDKRSSAELSETINSMHQWYLNAEVCYAYLSDVDDEVPTERSFQNSRWFTRGWTLQELIAPENLIFYCKHWTKLGEKGALTELLSQITSIDEEILAGTRALSSVSVAKRMSWAALRQTTRPEDRAYSLMGLFSVTMPMLYGEGGEKAFERLQEEIMKESDDHSLFAWVDRDASPTAYHGMLAKSPSLFAHSNMFLQYQDWESRLPYSMTNRGLQMDLPLTLSGNGDSDVYVAVLDCPVPPHYNDHEFLAIYLKKISTADDQYARIKVGQFGQVSERGIKQRIYIRQTPLTDVLHGVYPQHVLQLRQLHTVPESVEYRLLQILSSDNTSGPPRPLASSLAGSWVPLRYARTFKITKSKAELIAVVILGREDGERVAILLGSAPGFHVGFIAISLGDIGEVGEQKAWFSDQFENFKPSASGSTILLKYHDISVDFKPRLYSNTKYYMVDIKIVAKLKPESLFPWRLTADKTEINSPLSSQAPGDNKANQNPGWKKAMKKTRSLLRMQYS
ncbi:hypothetical protein MMC10_011105 [Thelotrema lepadinum]|nr:hypothetical protein [Thelotrema lepadinum]